MDYSEYEMKSFKPSGGMDMSKFFAEVEDVKRELMSYEDNVERIENLHRRALAETDPESLNYYERQIESIGSETRALAAELKTRIKNLQVQSTDDTRRTHSENVKRQFMTLIQKYQSVEAQSRDRVYDAAARQVRIVQPDATDEQIEQFVDSGGQQQVFATALLQNRRGQAADVLDAVQTRHQEILRIERTMAELAQLFQDMEVLVAEQDQQINDVDENVALAQHEIEQGVVYQGKAIVSARKARRKKWICLGILIAIVIIVIVIIFAYGASDGWFSKKN